MTTYKNLKSINLNYNYKELICMLNTEENKELYQKLEKIYDNCTSELYIDKLSKKQNSVLSNCYILSLNIDRTNKKIKMNYKDAENNDVDLNIDNLSKKDIEEFIKIIEKEKAKDWRLFNSIFEENVNDLICKFRNNFSIFLAEFRDLLYSKNFNIVKISIK